MGWNKTRAEINKAFPGRKSKDFEIAIGDFKDVLGSIQKKAKELKDDFEPKAFPKQNLSSFSVKNIAPAVKGGVDSVMAPFRALTGSIGAVTGAFLEVTSYTGKFVESLSPALMSQFNASLRDLNAVVGAALTPVIEVAMQVVREFSAIFLPISQQMQTTFRGITDVVFQVVQPVLEIFGRIVQQVADNLAFLVELYRVFLPIQTTFLQIVGAAQAVFSALLKTIMQVISGFLGGETGEEIKSFVNKVAEALQTFAKYTILAVAHLAKFLGVGRFVDNLIASLRPRKQDATGLAAAQNPQNQTAEAFGMMIARSAFIATVGGGGAAKVKTNEEWLEETVNELKKLQSGQETALDKLAAKIREYIMDGAREIVNAGRREVFGTGQRAWDLFKDDLEEALRIMNPFASDGTGQK